MRSYRSKFPAALIVVLLLLGSFGVLKIRTRFFEAKQAGVPSLEASLDSVRKNGSAESARRAPQGQGAASVPASNEDRMASGQAQGRGKIAARMSRRTDDLEIVTHDDGRQSIHLQGRFAHASAVVTGLDGQREVRCFSSFDDLNDAASTNPVPVPPPASPPRAEF